MNDLVLLTKGLCEIAIKNGIKMALAIERNDGTSTALIQSLKYMPHIQPLLIPFPAAEWKLNNAYDTNVDYEYMDEYGQPQKSDFGFAMNGAARDKIIALMQLLVRKYTRCIAVTDLVDEIKTLVVYSKKNVNGGTTTKIAAAPGKHDDIVMSVGHAYNAMYYHASILKRRHGIIVDVKKWLINENRTAFSFSNRPPSARITVTFKEVEGVMQEIFYDNKYNKVLTEEEVDKILSEENPTDKYVSDANYKPKEEVRIVDEMYERSVERFKHIGSDNIKVVTNEDYDLYKNGLADSNNIYDDNCVNMMNEMLSLAEQKF